MAILTQSNSNSHPFADQLGESLPPVGTFVATIIGIRDVFGVQRQKFQSQEMETVDVTAFLFGFRDTQNQPHKVASRQMRISGNEKSALYGFLKSLLGRAPEFGWDYCTLKGHKCLLTVEHVRKRDGSGVFAGIASISPLPANYAPPPPAAASPLPQPPPPAPTAPVPQPVPTTAPVEDDDYPF